MRLNLVSLSLLAVTVVAQESTGSSGDNKYSDLIDKINDLADKFPSLPSDFEFPTNIPEVTFFDGIGDAPSTLLNVLITGVPLSVYPDLFMPAGRSSLLNEFQEGNTPSWFNALPTDVKSYFSAIGAKMTSEGITMPTSVDFTVPTDLSDGGDGGDGGDGDNGEGTATSSALGSRPTGAIAGSLAVAAGILGAAIAL